MRESVPRRSGCEAVTNAVSFHVELIAPVKMPIEWWFVEKTFSGHGLVKQAPGAESRIVWGEQVTVELTLEVGRSD